MQNESTCKPCGAGKSSNQLGVKSDSDCTVCDAGKWSDEVGVRKCKPCNAGKWLNQTGASEERCDKRKDAIGGKMG